MNDIKCNCGARTKTRNGLVLKCGECARPERPCRWCGSVFRPGPGESWRVSCDACLVRRGKRRTRRPDPAKVNGWHKVMAGSVVPYEVTLKGYERAFCGVVEVGGIWYSPPGTGWFLSLGQGTVVSTCEPTTADIERHLAELAAWRCATENRRIISTGYLKTRYPGNHPIWNLTREEMAIVMGCTREAACRLLRGDLVHG